ncbi:MAG: hypothetical protein QM759_09005 [Terricaulis sp.]
MEDAPAPQLPELPLGGEILDSYDRGDLDDLARRAVESYAEAGILPRFILVPTTIEALSALLSVFQVSLIPLPNGDQAYVVIEPWAGKRIVIVFPIPQPNSRYADLLNDQLVVFRKLASAIVVSTGYGKATAGSKREKDIRLGDALLGASGSYNPQHLSACAAFTHACQKLSMQLNKPVALQGFGYGVEAALLPIAQTGTSSPQQQMFVMPPLGDDDMRAALNETSPYVTAHLGSVVSALKQAATGIEICSVDATKAAAIIAVKRQSFCAVGINDYETQGNGNTWDDFALAHVATAIKGALQRS